MGRPISRGACVLRTSLRDAAAQPAGKTSSSILTLMGVAALVLTTGAIMPAEAKKKTTAKPVEEPLPDPANGEPMTLVVSLSKQKVDIYRGTTLVTSSKVSTGMRGYATKAGVFSILEKKRMHHSNLYSGAPMPYMQRMTWSGTALHAGVVPGYPASHGCIRLPFSFAPKLFGITTVGEHVVVARDSVAPQIIEHEKLFQPLPPPSAPTMVKQDNPPKRQSSLETPQPEAKNAGLPVILAKADVGGVKIDRTPAIAATAFEAKPEQPETRVAAPSTQAKAAQIVPVESAAADSEGVETQVEDTRTHAVDPFVGNFARASVKAAPAETAAGSHALAEEEDVVVKADDVAPKVEQAKAAEPAKAPQPEALPVAAVEAPIPSAEPVKQPDADEQPVAAPEIAAMPDSEPASTKTEEPVANAAASTAVAAGIPAPASEQTVPTTSVVAEATPAAPVEATPETNLPAPIGEPIDEAELSPGAAKLMAGAKAAGVQAAEPRSTAPLRILVTRRTQRDRIIGVQRILSDMGYLIPVDFDGTLGKATVMAVKEFQKANEMPETGAFSDELVKKVYEVAGKEEPPAGHLFVRQEFGKVFDAPISFRDPETPLGTHLFTAMKFEPGDTKTRWMAVSVQGDDPAGTLDRLEVSDELRQKISERLTPGSSLIIGDIAINSASLPKGADFLVWAKDTPAKITTTSVDGDISRPKPRKKKPRVVRRPANNFTFTQPRNFGRSPWPW
jgi:lipoprotein-anchoring transpeptidase ErfK/SrfK